MQKTLVIIEAPGKRKQLYNVLRSAGLRNVEIEATIGHIAQNPDLNDLAITNEFVETSYRLKPEKEALAARIHEKASLAKTIYLATDDDQEGDVIARDTLAFCIAKEDYDKVLRLRLRSLSPAEVNTAINKASPVDELMASQGDSRRIIDRLIGSRSNEIGAIGRVQGALLLTIAEKRPVVGVVTHTMAAADGRGDFTAKTPVFAQQTIPDPIVIEKAVDVAKSKQTRMSNTVMNHDQILFTVSEKTGLKIGEVSDAMQRLYEKGEMTYARAKDTAISVESLKRLSVIAKAHGAVFDPKLFKGVRAADGEQAHEAPNAMTVDLPLNRDHELLTVDQQVLTLITRNLIDNGTLGKLEEPNVSELPDSVKNMRWSRLTPIVNRLWEDSKPQAGFKAWSKELSVLHLMMKHGLGRPSTVVDHVEKFLSRDLVSDNFTLTAKGEAWAVNVKMMLGNKEISSGIEKFIDANKEDPALMVKNMIDQFDLGEFDTLNENREEADNVEYEV